MTARPGLSRPGGRLEGGNRIGARYRHTTPEMAARVVHALDTRLRLALHVAEATIPAEQHRHERGSSGTCCVPSSASQELSRQAGVLTAWIKRREPDATTPRPGLLANLLANGPNDRDREAFWLVGVTGIEPVTSAV
jgi:hypothetical protein